jgi:alkylhydroperoxidase family enzyme
VISATWTDERLFTVAAWWDAPYFTDAERAALALAEAARHYDEQGLAVLILMIATANLFNRLNATTN